MSNFVRFDADGQIVQWGTCPDSMVHLQGPNVIEGEGTTHTHWVDMGTRQLIKKPVKDSKYHVWDYRRRRWVMDEKLAWSEVRFKRNGMLTASDWVELPSSKRRLTLAAQNAWDVYRQALRDLTSQPNPLRIDWPRVPQ